MTGPGPLDPVKVALVRDWLRTAFPSHGVADLYQTDRPSQCYLLDRGDAVEHRIYVSKEFLDDHTVEVIQGLLRDWHALDAIRAAEPRIVTITNHGVRVEAARRERG
jgi:hypothetical protein